MTEQTTLKWLRILLIIFIVGWASWLIAGHRPGSVISFDEGFHGGIGLYLAKSLQALFHGESIRDLSSLRGEFNNGIIYYPPLWNALAGVLGALFGPSTAVFRLATLLFSAGTGYLVYWLTKKYLNERAAFLAVLIFLTIPIVFIYSHLMMLEVPLAFGIALALFSFYYYLTTPRLNLKTIFWVALAFALGVQGKIIGIAVIYAVMALYGLLLLLFWRGDQQRQRFFSLATLVFVAAAALSWYLYVLFVSQVLHANMLGFFLGQSKEQAASHLGPLGTFVLTAWQHKSFYLRDLAHYPIISLIWFGALFGYVCWKKTPLSAFLLAYAAGCWIVFSGVFPQVAQYFLPIFVPLAVASGYVLSELIIKFVPVRWQFPKLIAVAVLLVFFQALAVARSETVGWRSKISHQETMAAYLATHAQSNDRVVTWNDGTTYAVRLATYDKRLQMYNGNSDICPEIVRASADWAIVEPGSNQTAQLALISQPLWEKVAEYPVADGTAYLFKSSLTNNTPARFEAERLAQLSCGLLQ